MAAVRTLFALALLLVTATTGSGAVSEQVTVLSAGAVEAGVATLADRFQKETRHIITRTFATGPEVAARLAGGEIPDVLIAPPSVMQAAVKAGTVLSDTQVVVARVGVGVTVRRGATAPNVATVETLRNALLAADSVVYNQASTGQYLETLFDRMGIAAQLKGKTTRYTSAAQVLEHVIAGKGIEIGFGPVTEIKTFESQGLVLVGPLPPDVQNYTPYVAAVMTTARASAARDFVRYLATPSANTVFVAAGAQ